MNFANLWFAGTGNKPTQERQVMKMKSTVIRGIIAITQPKWMRPALMTLAILATMLVVTGCPSHPH